MKYIVPLVAVVALVVALSWFYFGFHGTPIPHPEQTASASAPHSVKFKALESGQNASNEAARKNYAIYEQASFTSFWKETHNGSTDGMPVVDFTKSYVVGVFAGTEPSGGYHISVASVTDTGSMRSVEVRIEQPGDNCNVIEEQTSPYQFVEVPFTDTQAFTHTDTVVKNACK